MEKEQRVYDLQLKTEQREGGLNRISGYAAVFNLDSEDLGFRETIKPGAFKKALKKSDVRALKNHDPNLIFGRSNVNLRLKEDKNGLYMEVDPIATTNYRTVAEEIQAGLITQQSFGFTVSKDEWNEDYTRRTILEVDQVFDVSPVTFPAYPDTTVALRSRDAAKANPKIDQGHAEQSPKTLGDDELWEQFDKLRGQHEDYYANEGRKKSTGQKN